MCRRVFGGAEFNGEVYFLMQVPITQVIGTLGYPKIKLTSMKLKTCVLGFSVVLNSMVESIFQCEHLLLWYGYPGNPWVPQK